MDSRWSSSLCRLRSSIAPSTACASARNSRPRRPLPMPLPTDKHFTVAPEPSGPAGWLFCCGRTLLSVPSMGNGHPGPLNLQLSARFAAGRSSVLPYSHVHRSFWSGTRRQRARRPHLPRDPVLRSPVSRSGLAGLAVARTRTCAHRAGHHTHVAFRFLRLPHLAQPRERSHVVFGGRGRLLHRSPKRARRYDCGSRRGQSLGACSRGPPSRPPALAGRPECGVGTMELLDTRDCGGRGHLRRGNLDVLHGHPRTRRPGPLRLLDSYGISILRLGRQPFGGSATQRAGDGLGSARHVDRHAVGVVGGQASPDHRVAAGALACAMGREHFCPQILSSSRLSAAIIRRRGFQPPPGCFPAPSFLKYNTNCQRCNSGNWLNDGIPRSGFPLVIFQNSAPSLCSCTLGICRSAACFFARPEPSSPWHSTQFRLKSFSPPAAASGFVASGFFFVAASVGARQFGSCW